MVQTDPNMRPRMHEVLRRFDKTSRSLSSWKLRSRLAPRKESVFTATSRSWRHWKRAVGFIVHDVPPVPSKISGVVDSI
ncbi:hypothetical protein BDN72DRAFT_851609 [Pluteus cervinus]|uniref:Uncharacterized protein n=1 Tax=Pluteus cervinus TaxID=181527 RepID=A0ACD2ZZL1_9AGAR|nr:hypothetical protein BDN72DRAFT_851609 [Pluteus cervinus]